MISEIYAKSTPTNVVKKHNGDLKGVSVGHRPFCHRQPSAVFMHRNAQIMRQYYRHLGSKIEEEELELLDDSD
jgi:hypothetical protein